MTNNNTTTMMSTSMKLQISMTTLTTMLMKTNSTMNQQRTPLSLTPMTWSSLTTTTTKPTMATRMSTTKRMLMNIDHHTLQDELAPFFTSFQLQEQTTQLQNALAVWLLNKAPRNGLQIGRASCRERVCP